MSDLRNRRGNRVLDAFDRALLLHEAMKMCDEAQAYWKRQAIEDGLDVDCDEYAQYESDSLGHNYSQCLYAYSVSTEDARDIHGIVKEMMNR